VIICHCRAVSDRTVREQVAFGARELEAVADWCGAGGRCGGCRPALARLLADALRPHAVAVQFADA
jgi:bacterioferritin-associated ferredoxin